MRGFPHPLLSGVGLENGKRSGSWRSPVPSLLAASFAVLGFAAVAVGVGIGVNAGVVEEPATSVRADAALTGRSANDSLARLTSGFVGLAEIDEDPPTTPSDVQATPGLAPPVIATVTWAASFDGVGVAGYRIWRATASVGPYEPVGDTGALSYDDVTGLFGQEYWYSVSAYDEAGNQSILSAPAGPVQAAWEQDSPHAVYSAESDLCRTCHELHGAAGPKLARETVYTDDHPSASVCYVCHDGTGAATDILVGPRNSFSLASGHSIEGVGAEGDLTDGCGGCHNPHRDYLANRMLPRTAINDTPVEGADNSWCLACHNDTHDWYGPGYPALSEPVRDASGYPVSGRFPGRTVYEDALVNAHAAIPLSAALPRRGEGDCLYCHDSHQSASEYDALVARHTPSTTLTVASDQETGDYAALCLGCHGGKGIDAFPFSPPAGAVDIERFVTADAPGAGHRIKTEGGTLPVGAPLPCYNCHNPHGSSRGNSSLISDERGGGLSTASAAGVRAFCFTCHSTSDATPQVWDSVAGQYVSVGTCSVEGLRRDGSHPAGGNALNLLDIDGHRAADSGSCYGCHGSDYSEPGANNVHNPSMGAASRQSHTAVTEQSVRGCGACHKDARGNAGGDISANGEIWIEQAEIHFSSRGCAQCHPSPVDTNALPSGHTPECASCHTVIGDEYHDPTDAGFVGVHTASVDQSCTEFCHTGDIIATHQAYVAGVNGDVVEPEDEYTVCQLCHENEVFGVAAGMAGGRLRDTGTKPWTENDGDIYLRPGDREAWAPLKPGNTEFSSCDNCHIDPHGVEGYGGAIPDILALHDAQRTGEVAGITYSDGANIGCFAGCHTTNLLFEHLDADFEASWSGEIAGRTFSGNGTNCGRCHVDWGSHRGEIGDSVYLPAVLGAVESHDVRCQSCHNGVTISGAPNEGLRAPHSSGEVLNSATFGNYTGTPPLGTTTEFQDWQFGGGHNAMGTSWPKTVWIGTINGVTDPALAYNSSFRTGWGMGSAVRCSDCHVVGPANGPHGASVPYGIVSGPGYESAPGDWFKGTGPYHLAETGTGPAPVGLCAKCHGNFSGGFHTGRNNRHTGSNGNTAAYPNLGPNYSCVSCHLRIPHAWKRPRLLRRVTGGTIAGVPQDTHPYAFSAAERPGVTGIRINTSNSTLAQADCAENACGAHSGNTPYWP